MHPSLTKLLALVPPPKTPKGVGSPAQWAQAERQLGASLPEDYRQFVQLYGNQRFAGLYFILTPGRRIPSGSNLVQRIQETSSRFENYPPPYDLHPARPGLMVWGGDENGNYYYWLTKGQPDRWTVVSEETRGDGFVNHKCSMVDYLLRVQQLKIRALAGGYPPLVMRCPCELCTGWAEGSHYDEDPWYCPTCGYDWPDRTSFEADVADVVQRHGHRRACYIKKRGHFYPAPKDREPVDYKKRVRKELDDK